MAYITITLLVDATGLYEVDQQSNPNLIDFCTLGQLGGQLLDDSDSDLRNDISVVDVGDIITWNAVSNSNTLPLGATGFVVNIVSIRATTVFGQSQLLTPGEPPTGGTNGTTVTAPISSLSGGDQVTYSIAFNFAKITSLITDPPSQNYTIDPKIRVRLPH